VLLGLKVAVEPGVLHQLAKFDVIALICSWNGIPHAGMYAWSEHTRVGARHLAQVSMTVPRRKNAWGQLVRAKISGQAANLRCCGKKDWRVLASMSKDVRSGDPNNVEARAARYYWARIFAGDENEFSREPRGGDGRNLLLDYGYAVLRGYGVRAVLSAGLSPCVGVFHRNRANAFNLVEDLIEPFRPAVDSTVVRLSPEASLDDRSVKAALVESSTQAFGRDGISVAASLTDLAQQFGRYAEGQLDRLKVPAWDGAQTQTSLDVSP
jgi:CRISPR-associated protein Cas1